MTSMTKRVHPGVSEKKRLTRPSGGVEFGTNDPFGREGGNYLRRSLSIPGRPETRLGTWLRSSRWARAATCSRA